MSGCARRVAFGIAINLVLTACAHSQNTTPLRSASISVLEWRKQQRTIKKCMLQEGFEYAEIAYGVVETPKPLSLNFPRSVGDLESRIRDGYGIAARQIRSINFSSVDPNNLRLGSMTETDRGQYFKRLSECTKKGLASTPNLKVAVLRQAELRGRFLADSRVSEINAKWVKCMRSNGFEFAQSFLDIANDLGEEVDVLRMGADAARARELAIAKADAHCLEGSISVLSRVEAELASNNAAPVS